MDIIHMKCTFQFQSTLPVGGATGIGMLHAVDMVISIHAPRGGSDPTPTEGYGQLCYFNPRSPWGERLYDYPLYMVARWDFNPRSPWGERLIAFILSRT